ncbi:MAG: MFS transporter [Alphaproteobacteria bacterium]|nr:MFS transporter [Alphaproteobacteria bacterium]
MSDVPAAASASSPTAAPKADYHPLLGVVAVVIGAFISTINTRVTAVGLADIRGGLSLGFDEGSWVSTTFSAAQVLVALSGAWFSLVLGPRRLLLWSSSIFLIASILPPLNRDPAIVLGLQLVRGLAVGTFIPAVIPFILRELPRSWWTWGLAAYAFRFVFSQNLSSSIEAFYDENGLWQWIFWQNVPLTLLMMAFICLGMRRHPLDLAALFGGDWSGIAFGGVGLSLLFAGIDQGNRLDWLNSGTVVGLMLAGGLLIAAFVANEFLVKQPLIELRALAHANICIPPLLITLFLFGSSATSFVLPDYLTRVQGLRSLQIGDVLNWIALPQVVLVPSIAWVLRYVDARLMFASGLAVIAVGCWMDTELTHDWAAGDFLPSQLVEAVGLALAVTSVVTFAVANMRPAWAITIAGLIQIGRLMGNEIGSAFIQTFTRIEEQVYSNLTGLHLITGATLTEQRAAQLSEVFADRKASGDSTAQALLVLDDLIRREAYVLAYIDSFWIIAWVVTAGLVLMLFLHQPPPNPLTPPRQTA